MKWVEQKEGKKKPFWEISSIVYFVLHEKLVAFFFVNCRKYNCTELESVLVFKTAVYGFSCSTRYLVYRIKGKGSGASVGSEELELQ